MIVSSTPINRLRKTIFISAGDPNGIGSICFEKAFDKIGKDRELRQISLVYIGHFDHEVKKLEVFCEKCDWHFQYVGRAIDDLEVQLDFLQNMNKNKLIVYDIAQESKTAEISKKLQEKELMGGYFSIRALEIACILLKKFQAIGLCTLPLSKIRVAQALDRLNEESTRKEKFIDHTDYLAQFFGQATFMLMVGEKINVLLLTRHEALKDVSQILKEVLSDKRMIPILREIKERFPQSIGKWAMCGLNPHAGEGGLIGQEEMEWMIPWLDRMKKSGHSIEGPLPADALFAAGLRDCYRLFIANYHDQGLIPFKALEGMAGINCTLGLSFLRSSPAHGTAFGLARQRIDSRSTEQALQILLAKAMMEN